MTRDSISLFDSNNQEFDSTRECLLFPTYAKRDPKDNSQWIIRAKGWALSHNSSIAKQKMMKGITKSVAGKSTTDRNSSQMFEERFKYFLATNKRHVVFSIKAIGVLTLEESRKISKIAQYVEPLLIDSLNMLSTRITTNPLFYDQVYFPDTPPPSDDDDWYTKEDPYLLRRPSNPISSVLDHTRCHDLDSSIQDGIHLRTKGSGFLYGKLSIPHHHILNWAQEQNQCDARLLRIQSVCTISHKFSPNYNVVNLIEPTGISIISDIDDTIKDTQIKAGARTVLSKTFFESLEPVQGMADAYMAWYSQGASFHYVSNSPFQLMPMLDTFIRDAQFPPGSIHLRDDGKLISRLVETPGQAKREAILDILHDFPQRQFILIGDSGEIDLEIYTRIAIEYPTQIIKIFIRDVTTPTLSKIRQRSGPFSLFYSKRRTQSATDLFTEEKKSLSMRRAVTSMAEYAIEPQLTGHRPADVMDEACTQLYHRLEKARCRVDIDIVLFQHANVLQSDTEVKNSLWGMWDNNLSDDDSQS